MRKKDLPSGSVISSISWRMPKLSGVTPCRRVISPMTSADTPLCAAFSNHSWWRKLRRGDPRTEHADCADQPVDQVALLERRRSRGDPKRCGRLGAATPNGGAVGHLDGALVR